MTNVRRWAARAVLVAVLAGSLATAASGPAGAAAATGTVAPGAGPAAAVAGTGGHPLGHVAGSERARMCRLQQNRLAWIARHQSKFATGTAAFAALEAKAAGRGDSKLAAYWAKVVSHREASTVRQHARLAARTARGHAGGKCG